MTRVCIRICQQTEVQAPIFAAQPGWEPAGVLKIYNTKFDQTYWITYFEHAASEYRGDFSIKWTVFLWESFKNDIVFALHCYRCDRGAMIITSRELHNSDITTLFLGYRDKYKAYIHQINSHKSRRMIWTNWYANIMAMSPRSDNMVSWEQWMLPAGCWEQQCASELPRNHAFLEGRASTLPSNIGRTRACRKYRALSGIWQILHPELFKIIIQDSVLNLNLEFIDWLNEWMSDCSRH